MANKGTKWLCKQAEDGSLILEDYVKKDIPSTPKIVIDGGQPFISNHNGQVYTSRKKYLRDVNRAGLTVVGDQTEHVKKMASEARKQKEIDRAREMEDEIAKAANQVKYNDAPLSELDKERCKRQNEAREKDGT